METLKELGYQVLSAADGAAALGVLEANPHVNLLLDGCRDGGHERTHACTGSAERFPRLKVLYMTGYSRNAIVHHGRLDPGVDLIQKPFSQSALALRLRSLLAEAS